MPSIYLDYNATTPIASEVRDALTPFLDQHYGNPSSGHALGCVSHEAIENAREQLATALGAFPDEIVFTSGGTESNNLAIKGCLFGSTGRPRHVVVSAIEHPAVMEPARFLERLGHDLTVVGCGRDGIVDPGDVRDAIRSHTVLVSVMHANNEVGTIQPIREIAQICRSRGVLCHTDAAQSVGKVRVDVSELGVDLLSVAGHKLYAPKGVGALYVRRGVDLEPLLHGAGHERGRRAGTENTPYVVALGCAARVATLNLAENVGRLRAVRDRLYSRLCAAVGDRLSTNGRLADCLPNTLSVNFPRVFGSELLSQAPQVLASTGAACHSGSSAVSSTLSAMGIPAEVARGAVRMSVGWQTTEDEVDRAANMLAEAWKQLTT